MSRVEENTQIIKYLHDLLKESEDSVNVDIYATFTELTLMMDISKSLAVIADKEK